LSDKLIKALAYNKEIRAYVVDATNMVSEARKRHDSWNTATAALGRALIGSTLLGTSQKGDVKTTVRIQGNGTVGFIVVDSDTKGNTKGYIKNPHVSLKLNEEGKLDVSGAVGSEGTLTVSKDLGLKNPFVGQVPLISGELGNDFTYYMVNSEQIPSAIGLSVIVNPDESIKTAGGFMLQVLPEASEETITELENTITNLPLISELMDQGYTPEQILDKLVGENNSKILEEQVVQFKCDCSKERFANSISSLGKTEIQQMIDEDHGAEAVCHFCRNNYYYTEEELEDLKEDAADI